MTSSQFDVGLHVETQTSFKRDCDSKHTSLYVSNILVETQTSFKRDCDALLRHPFVCCNFVETQTSFKRDCDFSVFPTIPLDTFVSQKLRPHLKGIATCTCPYICICALMQKLRPHLKGIATHFVFPHHFDMSVETQTSFKRDCDVYSSTQGWTKKSQKLRPHLKGIATRFLRLTLL